MISPVLKDDAFLADVAAARTDRGRLHVWWLGQSGYLVQWEDTHLLLDPYLSDSLTRKYAETEKPHVRMTERVIDPKRLDFIDVATSSHNHTDHLDGETLSGLLSVNPKLQLVIPEANRAFVSERLGCETRFPAGVKDGVSVAVGPFEFTGIPAAHEEIERDRAGQCVFLGYVVRVGPWRIYHSGDTVHYDGMEELLRPHEVDLAILPINGSRPERRVAGNLSGREAARLAHAIGAKMATPCHYDMFEFNTATPGEFESACKELGQPYRVLRCGERWSGSRVSD